MWQSWKQRSEMNESNTVCPSHLSHTQRRHTSCYPSSDIIEPAIEPPFKAAGECGWKLPDELTFGNRIQAIHVLLPLLPTRLEHAFPTLPNKSEPFEEQADGSNRFIILGDVLQHPVNVGVSYYQAHPGKASTFKF